MQTKNSLWTKYFTLVLVNMNLKPNEANDRFLLHSIKE